MYILESEGLYPKWGSGAEPLVRGLGAKPQKLTFPCRNTTFIHFFADIG